MLGMQWTVSSFSIDIIIDIRAYAIVISTIVINIIICFVVKIVEIRAGIKITGTSVAPAVRKKNT